VLFVDALDERRAGRGDNNTIDRMVEKLFEHSPKQVRISCRAQDWLGDTDLAHSDLILIATVAQWSSHWSHFCARKWLAILTNQGVQDPSLIFERSTRPGIG